MSQIAVRIIAKILLVLAVSLVAVAQEAEEQQQPAEQSDESVIEAYAGDCSAMFRVFDEKGAVVPGARIFGELRTGFMGMSRTSLEVLTNSKGEAKIVGLPSRTKSAVFFDITKENKSARRVFDAGLDCTPEWEVILRVESTPE